MGVRFRRQYGIGNYIVDFYCPKLKLAVEVDGITHNEGSVLERDMARDEWLGGVGIIVLRYSSTKIFNAIDDVLMDIGYYCEKLSTAATPPAPSWKEGENKI